VINMVDIRRLYIVRALFSSPNQRASSEQLDSMTEKITLRFQPEVRKAIMNVRGHYRHLIDKPALNFYGLSIIKEADKEEVTKIAEEANKRMKEIEPTLQVSVGFVPLYLEQEAQGEVYQQVLAAIQARIYTELLGRLKEIAKMDDVPKRSRMALIKMCDRLQKWNVVDDPNVNKTLAEVKLQFENDIFKPVMEDLNKELASVKSRFAFLDLEENENGTVSPTPAAEEE